MTRPRKPIDEITLGMELAQLASQRSRDPATQHGAIIVDGQGAWVSGGCNELPTQVDDDDFDWSSDSKRGVIVHAEVNAIFNGLEGRGCLDRCTMFVTGLPCSRCALLIARAGITRVFYGARLTATPDLKDYDEARRIFKLCDIETGYVHME